MGRCIYCGALDPDAKLTREHIIPYSLGGRTVLPKASCAACAKITRQFEQTCARTIFGPYRVQENFPTRRPDERPTALPVTVRIGDRTEERLVPIEHYPGAPVIAMQLGVPGIIAGLPASAVYNEIIPVMFAPNYELIKGKLQRIRQKAGAGQGISISATFHMPSFARLLAKICHAYVVAVHGLDSFQPLLTDIILGHDDKIAYLIGGSPDPLPEPPPRQDGGIYRHRQETGIYTIGERHFLCARLQLFGIIGLPVYWVVVGIPSADLVWQILDRAPPRGQ